jgi:hypothetical protein
MEILVLRIRFGILLNLLMESDHQFLDSETIDRPSFSSDRKQGFLNSPKYQPDERAWFQLLYTETDDSHIFFLYRPQYKEHDGAIVHQFDSERAGDHFLALDQRWHFKTFIAAWRIRYDNPIPTRFLAPRDCSKIPTRRISYMKRLVL